MKERRLVVGLVVVAILGVGVTGRPRAVSAHDGHDEPAWEDDRIVTLVMPVPKAFRVAGAARSGPVVVYLNRDGGELSAGWDDAAGGSSSVLWGRGEASARIPAYGGTGSQWREAVACVRRAYAPFAVEVTDRRPDDGDYVMVMVGGDAGLLGYGAQVGGVAPYDGAVIARAIAFVFSETTGVAPDGVCQTIAHEVGHTLGLDHVTRCEDPMSYLYGCGEKRFADVEAKCGEYEDRECSNGQETQNSYRHLAQVVGLAQAEAEPEPEPEPQPEPEPEPELEPEPEPEPEPVWEPEPVLDTTAPEVTLYAPEHGSELAAGSTVFIAVEASDASGIAAVELGWAFSDTDARVFACDDLPAELPIDCARSGDLTWFSLLVGTGERAFAVRVTDGAGNATVTEARLLSFVD